MKKFVCLVIGVCTCLNLYSQWKVFTKYFEPTDTILSIQNHKEKFSINTSNVFIVNNQIINSGYSPILKNEKLEFSNVIHYCTKFNLNKNRTLYLDSTHVLMSFCPKGVKKMSLYFYSESSKNWYYKTFDVKNNIFNSFFIKLNDLSAIDTSLSKNISSKKLLNISKIYLIVEPFEQAFSINFGELLITNLKETQHVFYHPFFDRVCENNSLLKVKENSISSLSNTSFLISPFYVYSTSGSPELNLSNSDATYSKEEIFRLVINQIIDNYPFYVERNLDNNLIRNRVCNIFNSNLKYADIVDSISSILNTFGDPHLYIENNSTPRKGKNQIAPISLYEIANKFYISAVFDASLSKSINLEDEVVEVNNMNIQKRMDSLSLTCKGALNLKRKKALEKILYVENKDSVKINYVKKSDTLSLYIKYKNKIDIPNNFKPIPCDFKEVAKGVDYFYLNHFDNYSANRFFNSILTSNNKDRSLIIDIRNNGGGNASSVINILSSFISKTCILFNSNLPQLDDCKETLVITPNKHVKLNFKSIVILVNSRTTCASELFALAMKEHVGAIIVGDNNTGGAFANMYKLTFPDDLKIYFNCLSKETFSNYGSIENTGIKPDVYVWNNRISDLYPYTDKVLKTAIKLLQNL